jgi:hypothetical protein
MQVVGNSEKSSRSHPTIYRFSALWARPGRFETARIRIAGSGWVRVATLVALIAAFKYFAGADDPDRDSFSP